MVIGSPEGSTVSYAEIQKGLHKYIRDNNLRTDIAKPAIAAAAVPQAPAPEASKVQSQSRGLYCISCGEAIPTSAIYCDLCGALQ